MRRQRNIIRLFILTLALAAMVGVVTLVPGTAKLISAQAPVPGWSYTGRLNKCRTWHTATLLTNGQVLVVGGFHNCDPPVGHPYLQTAELYNPATGTWSYTGNLRDRRASHTATLLQNGQVLVVGGDFDLGFPPYQGFLQTAELYDPVTGRWRPTGRFISIRGYNSAILLPNGKVLAVGRSDPYSGSYAADSAELYDPATETWSSTNVPATNGLMTLLPNGKVLRLSGRSAELYDPATERWSSGGGLSVIRGVTSTTLLQNGKVLVTGVEDEPGLAVDAELYDPNTGTSTRTGNPHTGGGKTTLLTDGRVLMVSVSNAELYDPATGTWSLTSPPNTSRSSQTITPLPDGRVLVAGGDTGDLDWFTMFSSAELYTPPANPTPNVIDDAQFFVRQHYIDFLNRQPDPSGLAFWTNEISICGGDAQCIDAKRINVSAAYFLSIEFQQTGYLVYRFYKASFGNALGAPVPLSLSEFLPDTKEIGQGVVVNQSGWEQVLESNKQAFATEFLQRPRFVSTYPTSMSAEQFVDALFANAGVTPSATDRTAAINEFGSAMTSADVAARARALRRVAENSTLAQQEFNRALVLMQYFGYLRRNPNDPPEPGLNFDGYNFWLTKLTQFNGDYSGAEMVKAFITSGEYRRRFEP